MRAVGRRRAVLELRAARSALRGGTPEYSLSYPREAGSARRARRLVTEALDDWGLPGLAEDARLIVTELVSNAVKHTRSSSLRVTVTLLRGRGVVRVAVVDKSRAVPVMRVHSPDRESGRGLAVIDALSRWGYDRLPWGKRVWAELAADERGPS